VLKSDAAAEGGARASCVSEQASTAIVPGEIAIMKSLGLLAVSCLVFAACSLETSDEASETGANANETQIPLADPAEPFFRFEVRGHTIEFVETPGGGLVVSEIGNTDEPSVMVGLDPETASPTTIYTTLTASETVPPELAAYEERLAALPRSEVARAPEAEVREPVGSPEAVSRLDATPGVRLMHENGSAHFSASHCPTSPDSGVQWSFYEEHNPITTRSFCWAGGFTGQWTESSHSKATTQEVAAVVGNVCHNLSLPGWSGSWTVTPGTTNRVWARNGTFWDCCFICACGDKDLREETITSSISTGAPGCNAPGLTWRWGGGFWR
jgi:hypothetical protein